MGKYLNKINGVELPSNGKAEAIKKLLPDTEIIPEPVEWFEGIVCVVDNWPRPFEAAGYAFDKEELDRFKRPHDVRYKTWLYVPNAKNYVN